MQFYRGLKPEYSLIHEPPCLRVVQFYRGLKHDFENKCGSYSLRVVQFYRGLKLFSGGGGLDYLFESSAVL